jgi:RHS repeat-associated protein
MILPAATCKTDSGSEPDTSSFSNEINWKFEFDENDRLIKSIDPGGKVTELFYVFADSGQQMLKTLSRKNADGSVVYSFDNFGRLETINDAAGKLSFQYDGFSRVTSVRRNNEQQIDYVYNGLDQLTSYTIDNAFKVVYDYDFLGRIKTMKTPAGNISYEYWTGQSSVKRTFPNGISTYWKFTPDGKLESIEHVNSANSLLCKFAYKYGADGLIAETTEWSPKGERVLKYGYDVGKRLVSYETSDGEKTSYTYDSIGNRTSVTINGVLKEQAEYDGVGKMLTCNGQKCAYDSSGNLTSYSNAGKTSTFKYDAANKLSEANGVAYVYDGEGNLVSRRFNGRQSTYFPDPFSGIWKPLSAANEGSKKSYYLWEGKNPVAVVEDGKASFYLEDHLSSVRNIADIQGGVSSSLSFSAFGVPANTSSFDLTPTFSGLFFDPSTNIFITRARDYIANLGSFLQFDPLHQEPKGKQQNLSGYAFCGGDPINFVDKSGAQSNNYQEEVFWYSLLGNFNLKNDWNFWGSFISNIHLEADWNYFWRTPVRDEVIDQIISNAIAQNTSPEGFLNIAEADVTVTSWRQNPSSYQFSFPSALSPKAEEFQVASNIMLAKSTGIAGLFSPFWAPVHYFAERTGFAPNQLGGAPFETSWQPQTWKTVAYPLWEHIKGNFNRWQNVRALYGMIDELIVPPLYGAQTRSSSIRPSWSQTINTNINASNTSVSSTTIIENGIVPRVWHMASVTVSPMPSNVGGVFLSGAGKNLEGLHNITGVAVDHATGRIVLLGKNDRQIALPPLRLDDLVTIFRSVYNGEAPYVSIDPAPKNPMGRTMLTRHSAATIDTYVGWVLFETDRIMKGYSLSKDNETQRLLNSHVPGYQAVLNAGYVGNEYGKNIWTRFWIVPGDVTQSVSTNKDASLFDMTLKVNTQQMKMQGGELVPADNDAPTRASQIFADWFTKNYEAIAEEALSAPPVGSGIGGNIAVFKELKRIALITAIAENLRDNGTPLPFWMRDYKVKPWATPKTTPAITVETRTGQVIHQVYGGVDLSTPTGKTVVVSNSLAANSAATKVAGLATKPFLEALSLTVNNNGHLVSNTAVALPGTETKALAPCTLQETDLLVQLKHGAYISLERQYNSFFNPDDVFGGGWTLNLPQLEQQKMPYDRKDGRVKFRIKQNLITPLNSINVQGIKTFVGRNYRIGYETQMSIAPDDTRLHFNNSGNLVGIENNGFTTVYKRDKNERIESIEGYYYKNREAHIDLSYSKAGKLTKAKGSNDEYVDYAYDDAGNLISAEWHSKDKNSERVKYAYKDKKVEQIFVNDKRVKQFKYNPQAQLLAETDVDGKVTNHQLTVADNGYKFSSPGGDGVTAVGYNAAYMPSHVELADKSFINWTYNADRSVNAVYQTNTGQQYKIIYSADGKNRSMQLPEGGVIETELDDNGRLVKMKKGGEVVMQQVWQSDGSLSYTQYGNTVTQTEYNQEGEPVRILTGIRGAGNNFSEWVEEVYDKDGNVARQRDYTGKDVSYEYSDGEVSAVVINKNEVSISRKGDGRVKKIKAPWRTQSISYDGDDIEKLKMDCGRSSDEVYFEKGLPTKITQSDGGKWKFVYDDKKEHLKRIESPIDLSFFYKYNAEKRLQSVVVDKHYMVEYDWDEKGRVKRIRYRYR